MTKSKPVTTPIVPGEPVLSPEDKGVIPFAEAIGCLLYLVTRSRPDIGFAVSYLSRHMQDYTATHWQTVKRVFRYLNGTKNLCLHLHQRLPETPDTELVAFTDADYAGDAVDRKSTTGYVIFYQGAPVLWKSQKQRLVTTSTTEAEYVAIFDVCRPVLWLQQCLREIRNNTKPCPLIYSDSQSAIQWGRRNEHRKSKYLDVQYHFVRENVAQRKVELKYISTKLMVGDVLTKALPRSSFEDLRNYLCSFPNN